MESINRLWHLFTLWIQKLEPILSNSKGFSSLVLICVALLVRGLVILWLEKHTDISQHNLLQWRQRIRYITLIFTIVGMLIIWAPQLRTFALSIVAVAAALVVALKEIITCITGALIRTSVEGARIGGRIHIFLPGTSVHGDVIALDILSTTILEVNDNGQRTGKTIVFPNSMFLLHPATTESIDNRRYVLIEVCVPVSKEQNWQTIETKLLSAAQAKIEPYLSDAKKYFQRFDRKYGFRAPGPEPKILLEWVDPQRLNLNLRMAVPVTEQNAIRQELIRAALAV